MFFNYFEKKKRFLLSRLLSRSLLPSRFTHREDQIEDEEDVLDGTHPTRLHGSNLSRKLILLSRFYYFNGIDLTTLRGIQKAIRIIDRLVFCATAVQSMGAIQVVPLSLSLGDEGLRSKSSASRPYDRHADTTSLVVQGDVRDPFVAVALRAYHWSAILNRKYYVVVGGNHGHLAHR